MSKFIGSENSNKIVNEIALASQPDLVAEDGDASGVTKEIFTDCILDYGNPDGFEILLQEGGGEGGAESCYTVFSWKGIAYKYYYSYYSYNGYDFDGDVDLEVVTQKQRTITVWE